jgi:thiamine-monophosphate kinase
MKMNYESKIIKLVNDIMPESLLRLSKCFEADAEVILLGGKKYLFTTDDFSKEDLFLESDPFSLGWNVACASISDIIAAGGIPLVYSHSMVISNNWDEKYIAEFSKGIAEVLKIYSISFTGGDLGKSEDWRYTSSVIGKSCRKILNRKGMLASHTIFITGESGAGNLQAAMNLFSHATRTKDSPDPAKYLFRTHENIVDILSKYASSSIDTSDGVFSALKTLSDLNLKGFVIDNIPIIPQGVKLSEALGLPVELFILGECGEYEILFTVSDKNKTAFIKEIIDNGLKVYEIGKVTTDKDEKIISMNGKTFDLKDYDINARDFDDVKDYLGKVKAWVSK